VRAVHTPRSHPDFGVLPYWLILKGGAVVKRRDKLQGQGLVEYSIVIALVAVIASLALAATGTSISDVYCGLISGLGMGGPCEALFSEDFSDLSNWLEKGGNWDNSSGQLCNDHYGTIFAEDFSDDDYVIDLGTANLATGWGYGVFFRVGDPTGKIEGYIFQYDPGYGAGAFLFRKWVDGHELAPFAVEFAPGFDWYGEDHRIQVRVVGNTFTAYLDGQQVVTGSDDTYSSGGVGFRTWDATEACFDDLSISAP